MKVYSRMGKGIPINYDNDNNSNFEVSSHSTFFFLTP